MSIAFPASRTFVRTGALLLVLAAGAARADTVVQRVGALEDVEVTGLKGGKVQFKNRGTGKVDELPLGKVKALQIDGVDAVAAGQKLVQEKSDKAAAAKFTEALRQAKAAKKPWLAPYLLQQIFACHKRTGDARLAAQAYLDLIQEKPDPAFLDETFAALGSKPDPMLADVVKAADPNVRKTIYDLAKQARGKMDATQQPLADGLLAATGITEPDPVQTPAGGDKPGAEPAPVAAQPGGGKPAAGGAPVVIKPGSLLLPTLLLREIQENSAAATDMQPALAGRYSDAVKAIRGALHAKNELTAIRLFVLGRVLQDMAEQEKDAAKKADLLKEAAENFARVGAQFNEPDSSYYAPSMLEFARINAALGNLATARKVMTEIADYGDTKEEPAYVGRFNAFKASLEK